MTCAPHAAQINLRFCNSAREYLDFRASVRSGNFARERLNFLRQNGVDKNGQAQPVAVCISRRAGSALSGFVGPLLARAFARLALILPAVLTPRFNISEAGSQSDS
jgi:hypothetical protein